jgi:site-specific DNA-methyltransferase (adenine-specific)
VRPYYDQGGITIYHGDCRDVLPDLPIVDAVITDPPYGTGVTEWDQSISDQAVAACVAAMRGYAVFCYSNTRLAHILTAIKAAGAEAWVAVWHKSNSVGFERKFAPQWTPIVIAYRKPRKFWGKDLCYCPITVQPSGHPTPKPPGVMRWIIEHATDPGDLVLDPYMGSGTTLEVASRNGRRAIGIDVREAYCEIAAERLRQRGLPLEEIA